MLRHLPRVVSPLGLAAALLAARIVRASPPFAIELRPLVTSGLSKPVYLTHAGDGSGRLFVVELEGRIRVVRHGQLLPAPYLDLSALVSCCQEQGLLSVAFDPNFELNGTFYVNYTDRFGDTVVARYVAADAAADVARPISVTTVLTVDQPYYNHNGGQLQFGPRDHYLYIGMGDGGGAGDPDNRGQSLDTLLGKMLRLHVRGVPTYTVPATNPFLSTPGARPEIWAFGLRNPWRFSFDRATGDMYIADVGAACYEEVDVERAGTPGGRNYGWRKMEGFHAFNRDESHLCNQPRIAPAAFALPEFEYPRGRGNVAVVGGYVYRGQAYPHLTGAYIFGDFGSGRIWALWPERPRAWRRYQLLDTAQAISSFGEDEQGELYVIAFGGQVSRIAARGSP